MSALVCFGVDSLVCFGVTSLVCFGVVSELSGKWLMSGFSGVLRRFAAVTSPTTTAMQSSTIIMEMYKICATFCSFFFCSMIPVLSRSGFRFYFYLNSHTLCAHSL